MKRIILLLALVLLGLAAGLALANMAPPPLDRNLQLKTSDGVTIIGTYEGALANKSKAVILLHMLNRNRQDWQKFSALATAKGISTLAIDLRGHGKSIKGPNGENLQWKNFQETDFQNMNKDVQAAYDYLRSLPEVDTQRIGIVGASIGSNLAVQFAAANPDKIKSVVLLSPGKEYRGVTTEAAVKSYSGKMLFYATPGDDYSYNSVNELMKLAGTRGAFNKLKGKAHGTDIFAEHPETPKQVIDWLTKNL